MDYLQLSKIISYILRHAAKENSITIDAEGWVDLDELLHSIRHRYNEYKDIKIDNILAIVSQGRKKRHEINGKKIRALYGHSMLHIEKRNIVYPPLFLYHGTTFENLHLIRKSGIKKMARQYVHMSEDINQAKQVAFRKTKHPIILRIRASDAAANGINFYNEGEIWLCDFLPHSFIDQIDENQNIL